MTTPFDESTVHQLMLDSRFKEDMFRRFEPLITIAVARFPVETEFNCPDAMALTTFAARFRDSMLSLGQFKWHLNGKQGPLPDGTGTTIDLVKLQKMEQPTKLYMITPDAARRSVWFRQRQASKRTQKMNLGLAQESMAAAPTPIATPWTDVKDEEVYALCQLLSTRRLIGPYILLRRFTPEETTQFQSAYDVAITWDDTQKYTIIS